MIKIILLSALLFGCVVYIILLRKQIHDFTKQLQFHAKEESNREITSDLKSREVKTLQHELNMLLDKIRQQRIAYEKEEEKIQQTVTDISHDIRTPLTSVIGYFQMLDETTDHAEREHYKTIIYSKLQALNAMLDDFFVYSRIKTTKKEKGECDIRQILCETIFLFYDDFNLKGIQPQIDIPEERFTASGNDEDFRRIFMNLMKNVLMHGEKEICISMRQQDKGVAISFENRTTEALPPKLSDVFERFYKGDTARSGRSSTGLGLCIVKELAEKMGGTATTFSRGASWFGIRLWFG